MKYVRIVNGFSRLKIAGYRSRKPGNAILETIYFKISRGSMARIPSETRAFGACDMPQPPPPHKFKPATELNWIK